MSTLSSITPKLRQQLHISGINMMNTCGQRFFYRYILGLRRPPSAYVLVGKATDGSVTADLEEKIRTGELLPRKDVLEVASAVFDRAKDEEPIELDPDEKREGKSLETVIGEAKDKTVALAGLHHDEAAPAIEVKKVHRRFSINMDTFLRKRAKELHTAADTVEDKAMSKRLHAQARAMNAAARAGLDFAGEQDILEIKQEGELSRLIVRDTKTSGKSPTKSIMDGSTRPGIADDSDQLTGYACASTVLDGKTPDMMVLDYLVRTPTGKLNYVPTKTVRTLDDIQVFLNRFANAVQAMRSGVFVPAKADDWQCSERYCGYADICPYIKRTVLVQIQPSQG